MDGRAGVQLSLREGVHCSAKQEVEILLISILCTPSSIFVRIRNGEGLSDVMRDDKDWGVVMGKEEGKLWGSKGGGGDILPHFSAGPPP
jgi:hypothetical protein